MSDSSRPVAPFLPAEIVANILTHVCPKYEKWLEKGKEHPEFGPISRISNCWRVEGQRRLFETIKITGSVKLSKVNNAGLFRFIRSLTIDINYGFRPTTFDPMVDQLNFVLLLISVHNLKFLRLNAFHQPSYLPDLMTFILKFPELSTVESSTRNDREWSRCFIDPILNESPNLQKLTLGGTLQYNGSLWSSSLPSLKFLVINRPDVLKEKVFGISKFKGLESLAIQSPLSQELAGSAEFFRVVGPSLRKLKIHTLPPSASDLNPIWTSLNVVEDLHVSYGSITSINTLPPTIIKLRMLEIGSGDEATFDTLINMKELFIGELTRSFDLSSLPPLNLLSIRIADNTNWILESLSHFRKGGLKRLMLRDFNDCAEIMTKCEELGIVLGKLIC